MDPDRMCLGGILLSPSADPVFSNGTFYAAGRLQQLGQYKPGPVRNKPNRPQQVSGPCSRLSNFSNQKKTNRKVSELQKYKRIYFGVSVA